MCEAIFCMAGEDDNSSAGKFLTDRTYCLDSIHIREAQIHQCHIGPHLPIGLQRRLTRGNGRDQSNITRGSNDRGDAFEKQRMVIDRENIDSIGSLVHA